MEHDIHNPQRPEHGGLRAPQLRGLQLRPLRVENMQDAHRLAPVLRRVLAPALRDPPPAQVLPEADGRGLKLCGDGFGSVVTERGHLGPRVLPAAQT
ncbi:MAG: hypothetical protein ACK56I_01370, partial [bacterium]